MNICTSLGLTYHYLIEDNMMSKLFVYIVELTFVKKIEKHFLTKVFQLLVNKTSS